eukprot:TRINITY_DN23931_c0_g1_i1.p1 TRINITY_DN23931_c0_g1~~TRINITY_DN23931_c0_g1_i1.p1  ORF type:complete len:261 (+),score=34.94 TRINITY_DN23931_c0_g1_i1:76-858(+)
MGCRSSTPSDSTTTVPPRGERRQRRARGRREGAAHSVVNSSEAAETGGVEGRSSASVVADCAVVNAAPAVAAAVQRTAPPAARIADESRDTEFSAVDIQPVSSKYPHSCAAVYSSLPAAALREEPAKSPCSSPASEPEFIPLCGAVVLAALQKRPPTPPMPRPDPSRPPPRPRLQSAMRGGRGLPPSLSRRVSNKHAMVSICAPIVILFDDEGESRRGSNAARRTKRVESAKGGAHGSRSGGRRERGVFAGVAALFRRRP